MRTRMILLAAAVLLGLCIPTAAKDFGDPADVKQVRIAAGKKFKQVTKVSVSHDWALCGAYNGENDLSVILRRTGKVWKVVDKDGGAYSKDALRKAGVPQADIAPLLRAYQ